MAVFVFLCYDNIMSNIEELKKVRLEKLKNLIKAGINPYPAEVLRTHTNKEALDDFKKLANKKITLVGRLRSIREHGGSTFCHIEDGLAQIQIYLRKDKVGEKNYKLFLENLDIGDFIEVAGTLFLTKKGEKTLDVSKWRIISKSLLPLPSEWYGFEDVEERYRKRYLDILMNPETKQMFEKKAKFWESARQFLIKKGFLEVETPVLETTTGGADAKPFVTHHNALDIDVYLRISMGELWQKKLMVAGFEKTFEIGRQFRNEGMDDEHLQDYTQMEFYWGYADYEKGMKLVEELYKYVVKETFGTMRFKIRGFDINLGKKWEKYDYRETIKKYSGIDISNADLSVIEKKLESLGIEYDKKGFNLIRAIDDLWKYCRKKIAGPGFLINLPVAISPLAKRLESNPNLVQRFQVIVAGAELGNGYSELNDPIDQAERFKEQQKLRDQGDEEAQMYDSDFVEALEYGMPPTCGFGMSERVFSVLMDKSVRECQIFPLMRPKEKND